jgi:alcohol dehydrogenase class IV
MEQRTYIGGNFINNLQNLLENNASKKIFLVRSKTSYKTCGAEDFINKIISELDCTVLEFSNFSDNPKYEDMLKGIELLENFDADIIVAVGGGSAMDMSKLIRFFFSYQGDVTGKVFQKSNNKILPLIAIPTTAGTGAEATHFSVLYKDKVKYSVEHDDMLPDYAIIYPLFTYNNPKYLTACTGFDALAQAIEAYWNKNATDESDSYAEKAISMIWNNLPIVVNNPNNQLRDKISEGAYWAGRAINITKTTAPHAFSYPFTTYYNYPHGHAVAITFPFFMKLNCSNNNEKSIKLLSLLGYNSNDDLEKRMLNYIDTIGLRLKKDDSIDIDFVLGQVNLERLKNNPEDVDIHALKEYLSNI